MSVLRYHDTRGLDSSRPAFAGVVTRGLADGGGLYVPESLPSVPLSEILSWHDLPYHERSARLFGFFEPDIESERIARLTATAYSGNFDDPRIAPLIEIREGFHVLELWHGPTFAFKDMALQCLPLFFSEAVSAARAADGEPEDFLILVATSGDTGTAALDGFAGVEGVKIAVFYPRGGVSEIQRKQMVTRAGENIVVFGVEGSFDDCQSSVKAAFGDDGFNTWLAENYRLRLSSANSINWGRLLPQIVYYAGAYCDMVSAGGVQPGRPVDLCIPTGNFGNILAAWYAKRCGVPIDRLICASNENRVLTDFFETGVYDLRDRILVRTPSPSMDILVSSNFERLLFELGSNAEMVRSWMGDLVSNGHFEVDGGLLERIREEFTGGSVSNEECLATIRRVHEETGYLIDPHTAVAWQVADRQRGRNPVIVVSTAHWAKFGRDVLKALESIPFEEPLPGELLELSETALLEQVLEIAPGQQIPENLANLDALEERFTGIVPGSRKGIEDALTNWLEEVCPRRT